MKTILLKLLVIFTIFISCDSDTNVEVLDEMNETTTLSQNEIDDLLFLREEEKLARDVYLYSFEKYGTQIFKNISNSESTHMEGVLTLLNKYDLEDPIINEIGKFSNKELQEIYNKLIDQSNISLLEALEVGNTIEDLDINDIEHNEKRTKKEDLLIVYGSLKCGSRNHLRNFNNLVVNNGGSYNAQYITQIEFNEIVGESNEQCGQIKTN